MHIYDLWGIETKVLGRLGAVILFFAWIPWLGMVLAEQPMIEEVQVGSMMYFVGLFQVVAGFSLMGLGLKEKPDFDSRMGVTASGVYSKFLHPVYYGMIFLTLGIPLLASSLYALYTAPLWIAFIYYYMVSETRYLEVHLCEKYRKIKKEVII